MSDDNKTDVKGFNIASLRTDKSKDVEGVWQDHNGLELLIARSNNPKAKAYRNKLYRKNRIAIQAGEVEIIEELNNKVTAKHVLLDWKHLQDIGKDGKVFDVLYSEAVALKYLNEMDKFAEIITEYAGDFEAYQVEGQEEDVKN